MAPVPCNMRKFVCAGWHALVYAGMYEYEYIRVLCSFLVQRKFRERESGLLHTNRRAREKAKNDETKL